MIAIVDYSIGNLQSLKNAFDYMGIDVFIEKDPNSLKKYSKIILPGVGAFADAIYFLRRCGMDEAIGEFAKSGKYILGICLGMQLFFEKSFELKQSRGLGLIEGEVVYFKEDVLKEGLKIPHMGWNRVFIKDKIGIFRGLGESFYLYFAHSYHAICDKRYALATSFYSYEFISCVVKDNIIGIQGHPEKSHEEGLKILENFALME